MLQRINCKKYVFRHWNFVMFHISLQKLFCGKKMVLNIGIKGTLIFTIKNINKVYKESV